MKRILSLLLVITTALTLAACSGNKKEKTPEKVALEHVYLTEKTSFPEELEFNTFFISGDSAYVRAYKNEAYTDENGEEMERYFEVIYKADKNFGNLVEIFRHESKYEWDENTGTSTNEYLENIYPGINGSVWINVSSYKSYPKDSSQTEWVNENNAVLYNYDSEGNLLNTFDVKSVVKSIPEIDVNDYQSMYISSLVQTSDGIVYVLTNDRIIGIGEDGTLASTLELEESTYFNNVAALENGKIRTTKYNWVNEQNSIDIVDYDMKANTSEKIVSLATNDNVMMDTKGNVYTNDYYVVSRVDLSSGEETPILDWINSDINCDRIFQIIIDNNEVYAFEWDNNYTTRSLLHLTPAGEGEIIEKYVITLATNELDSNLKGMIIDYNRSSAEYRISVKAYGWEEADATRFDQDLLAGNVPDIISLNRLDAYKYATKGMFADLGEFLDTDDTISRDSFLPNILKASEINGKIYRLPVSFSVRSLVGKASVVGDRESWTWDDLLAVKENYPNAEYISEMDRNNAMETILPIIIEDFVDYDTLRANFTDGNFAKFLDFIKTMPKEIDWETYYKEIDWEEYDKRFKEDRTLFQIGYLNSLYPYSYLFDTFGEPINYIGFPSSSGSGNAVMFGAQFAIGAKSIYKQQAWDFLKMIFEEEYQSETIWEIPVIAAVAEKKYQEAKDEITALGDDDFYIDDDMVVTPRVTKEVIVEDSLIAPLPTPADDAQVGEKTQMLLQLADNTYRIATTATKLVRQNDPVIDIIIEEAAPYLDGSKTLAETCKVIESRVNLFLSTNM